jgi:hypothetical protein
LQVGNTGVDVEQRFLQPHRVRFNALMIVCPQFPPPAVVIEIGSRDFQEDTFDRPQANQICGCIPSMPADDKAIL